MPVLILASWKNRVPILDVKEIDPLPENLGLVIRLYSQTLSCIQPPKPLLQFALSVIIHWRR
jgi:hypothetical protein